MTGFDSGPHNGELADKPKKGAENASKGKEKKEVSPVKEIMKICIQKQADFKPRLSKVEYADPDAQTLVATFSAELKTALEKRSDLTKKVPTDPYNSCFEMPEYLTFAGRKDKDSDEMVELSFKLIAMKKYGVFQTLILSEEPKAFDKWE